MIRSIFGRLSSLSSNTGAPSSQPVLVGLRPQFASSSDEEVAELRSGRPIKGRGIPRQSIWFGESHPMVGRDHQLPFGEIIRNHGGLSQDKTAIIRRRIDRGI